LRQIGIAANAAANDNNNTYPIIEIDANGSPVANTLNVPALPLDQGAGALWNNAGHASVPGGPERPELYASQNPHSSYMWSPYSEDSSSAVPTIYRRVGRPRFHLLISSWRRIGVAVHMGLRPKSLGWNDDLLGLWRRACANHPAQNRFSH